MHPAISQQLAAEHIRELMAEASDVRRAQQARRAQPWPRFARLWRSGRPYAQRRESRLGPAPLVGSGAGGPENWRP